MGFFHTEVFVPRKIRAQINVLTQNKNMPLTYSGHALSEAVRDRYGNIPTPGSVNMQAAEVFEVGSRANNIDHLAFRISGMHANPDIDVVMACAVKNGKLHVKTLWANHINDKHKTLDKSKYDKR